MTRPNIRSFCCCLLGLLAWVAPLTAAESVQSFDIPAGRAERTLERFARQSSQPAMFSTDLIRGVHTLAVKGELTPFDALTTMLGGSGLVAVRDEATGALLVKPVNARNDVVVELPPYLVQGATIPLPWRYAEAPGVEVLSLCSDASTRLLLNHHFRLRNTLTVLLPEEFQVQLDLPITYVLFDATLQPGMARELTRELDKHRAGADNWIINGLSNYRFSDRDAMAMFFIIDDLNFSRGRLTITPEYFRSMLTARTPTLPPWFIEGMCALYENAILESVPPGRSQSMTEVADPPLPEGVIALRPVVWGTTEETEELRKDPLKEVEFLPLAQLFAGLPTEGGDAAQVARWQAQAAFFIRWALDGDASNPRREALWRFVRETTTEPATEERFEACFGSGYKRTEGILRDYLQVAIKRRCYLSTTKPYEPPALELHDATDSEISRLKGRLDRMEISFVRRNCPELTPRYIAQARQTLRRAYDKGDRDPRLLAELGLTECEAADDRAARPFLEAAVAAKVLHPRAYYELARIYYQDVLAEAEAGRLSAAQAGKVLQPLAHALRQKPPLAEGYELIAEVWLRTDGGLTPAQLDVLTAGLRRFPRDLRLRYSAALLNSLHGRPAEAKALAEKGLDFATDAKERQRFERLLTALAEAPAPAP